MFATVRDKNGTLIHDLEKDDFQLKEDGKKQTIEYFSRQADLPLTLGLLVDTSLSQWRVLEEQRTASYRFFDRVLEDQDQAFVISFDIDTELLQDLTGSKERLDVALDRLETPISFQRPGPGRYFQFPGSRYPGTRPPRGGRGGPRSARPAGVGTVLYDAVYLSADEVLTNQAGRKALVVISDGADHGSKLPVEEAIEAVHRTDGIIYSIYFADREGPGGGWGGRGRMRVEGDKVLREMSEETGGQLYKLSDELTLDEVFDRIEEDLRSQYSIGYRSKSGDSTEFRKIQLKTKQGGLTVFSPQGLLPCFSTIVSVRLQPMQQLRLFRNSESPGMPECGWRRFLGSTSSRLESPKDGRTGRGLSSDGGVTALGG